MCDREGDIETVESVCETECGLCLIMEDGVAVRESAPLDVSVYVCVCERERETACVCVRVSVCV